MIRGLFQCLSIESVGGRSPFRRVVLQPYRDRETPAELRMTAEPTAGVVALLVDNREGLGRIEPMALYYLDLTPVAEER